MHRAWHSERAPQSAAEILVLRIRAGSPRCPDQPIRLRLSTDFNRIPARAPKLQFLDVPKLLGAMFSDAVAGPAERAWSEDTVGVTANGRRLFGRVYRAGG